MSDLAPLGLLAGNGQFPAEVIKRANLQGRDVVTVGVQAAADIALAQSSAAWLSVRLGQINRAIKFFKQHGVTELVIVGGVKRINLWRDARPDWRMLKMLARLRSFRDDALLRSLANEFESVGIAVVGVQQLLPEMVVQAGLVTSRNLTQSELRDAKLGWGVAKQLGELDVGQAVVVKDNVVIALEGIEGTDALIARSGKLANGGGVLVKVSKPIQDLRLDLPSFGPNSVKNLKAAGLSAVVLEAGRTLMLDPAGVARDADAANIAILVSDGILTP